MNPLHLTRPVHSLHVHSPSLSTLRSLFPTLPHSPSVSLSLSSLPHPLRSVVIARTLVLSSNPHCTHRRWLQVHCSPLISFLILGNIRLCFIWDFDYFVETYLKVVNLLIKMRILLSFLQWWWSKVFLAIWLCLCYFLINEFKCACDIVGIGVLVGAFDKSISSVVVISLGLCKMCLILFWLIGGCALCKILMILLNLS